MFQSSDQILHFPCTDLRGGELDGCLIGESGLRGRKPEARSFQVTLEELERESHKSREADKSIGLLGLEPLGNLAPRQGASRNLEEFRGSRRREVEDPSESFEGFVGEAFPDAPVELGGFERP